MSINNIHWEDIAQFVENHPSVLRDAPVLRKHLYENGPISAADLLAWQSTPRQSAAGLLPVCEYHVDLLDAQVTRLQRLGVEQQRQIYDLRSNVAQLEHELEEERERNRVFASLDDVKAAVREAMRG